MKRERATQLLEEMLERIADGGPWIDLIDRVYVFGSYARGALEPSDIDVAVDYTPDRAAGEFFARALAAGRDWHSPLKRELNGRRRGFQFTVGNSERLAAETGFDLTLLHRRGDSLEAARRRLQTIRADPAARPARRDAMLPAFEGLEKHLHLPVRKALVELNQLGAIKIERIALPDGEPTHPRVRRILDIRWPSAGASRRVVQAALAYFEANGHDPTTVMAGDRALGKDRPTRALSWTLARLNHLPEWLRSGGGEWVAVANPTRTRPLTALRITPRDCGRIPEGRWRLLQ